MVGVAQGERLERSRRGRPIAALLVGDAEPVLRRQGELSTRFPLDEPAEIGQRAVVLSGSHRRNAGPPEDRALIVGRRRGLEQAGKERQAALDVPRRHEDGGKQYSGAAPLPGRGAGDASFPDRGPEWAGAVHVAHAHGQAEFGQADGGGQRAGRKSVAERGAGGDRRFVVALRVQRFDPFRGDPFLRPAAGERGGPFVEQRECGLEAGGVAEPAYQTPVLRLGERWQGLAAGARQPPGLAACCDERLGGSMTELRLAQRRQGPGDVSRGFERGREAQAGGVGGRAGGGRGEHLPIEGCRPERRTGGQIRFGHAQHQIPMARGIAARELGEKRLCVRRRSPARGALDDGAPREGAHEDGALDYRAPDRLGFRPPTGGGEQRGAQDRVFQRWLCSAGGGGVPLEDRQRLGGPAGLQLRRGAGKGRGRKPEAGRGVRFLPESGRAGEKPGEAGHSDCAAAFRCREHGVVPPGPRAGAL